jgi:hypothetical protein
MKNGYGVMLQTNGEKYKGYFKNDLFDGRGKLCTKISKYDGEFLGGKKQG